MLCALFKNRDAGLVVEGKEYCGEKYSVMRKRSQF